MDSSVKLEVQDALNKYIAVGLEESVVICEVNSWKLCKIKELGSLK